MIGQTISHYRIVDKLGEGGMGAVYIAEDTLLGRRVAVKLPTTTEGANKHHSHSRFLREARAVSALSHPHIAAIYDYGETADGHPFIVMELIEGQTLSELLAEGSLTLGRAVEIISEVAEALAEAHARGIIHRDIKPSNIIINTQGQVKVLDFGLAKQLHEEASHSADPNARTLLATHTQSGIVIGTPLYLSPEQAKGEAVDARSDLFALGAVFYECIAGKPAFSVANASMVEIAYHIIHVDPAQPSVFNSHVPKHLDGIALKALAKKPSERYQSAAELIAALHLASDALDEKGHHRTQRLAAAHTGHSSALQTLSDALRRPRLSLRILLLVLLCIGIIFGAVKWWQYRSPHVIPGPAQRWYNLGTEALREGAFYQASMALEQAIAAYSEYALAHARLADALMELDDSDRAKDELLRVAELTGDRSALPQLDALYLDAITATVTRDFTRAIKSYSDIAQLTPGEPHVYVDLGRAYEKNEDLTKAIENYVEATRRGPQYATAFLRVGILYGRNLDLASATAAFDKAETLYRAMSNLEGVTEVHYQRGTLLNRLGYHAEARAQLQQALDTTKATRNQPQKIKTLLQLSNVARSGNEMAQAEQYATEAVELARAGGLVNLTTDGYLGLGNIYYARNEWATAEKYFKQALEFAQRYKGRRNEARALLTFGSLLIQQDNADEALPYVQQALPFYQQGGYRKEVSQATLLLARAHRMKGNYAEALKILEPQLQLAEQTKDKTQLALLYGDLGTVLAQQERYPEALKYYEQGYAVSTASGNRLNASYDLTNRGDMLWRLGNYQEAGTIFAQVLSIAEQSKESNKPVLSLLSLAKAAMALSRRSFGEAIKESQQAIAFDDSTAKHITIMAKHLLGTAKAFSGAKDEGKRLCQEAVEMASRASDPKLLSFALLAHAEVLLESGDAQGALSAAQQAQERFKNYGQQESEWRAWLIMGQASQRLNEPEAARDRLTRAHALLTSVQQNWGEEVAKSYLQRPDIQLSKQRLDKALLAQL